MFVPSTRAYNVQCMLTGNTFQTDLDELAGAMEGGNPLHRKPFNEIAFSETRLFFEIDGPIPTDLEERAWVALRHHTDFRKRFPLYAKLLFRKRTILRSSKGGAPRFHVVHPNVVLSTAEYYHVIKDLQTHFPDLDRTCNLHKAWLRFPKAPKRDEKRSYHLVKGTYRNAFINAHSNAGTAVNTKGIVGKEDAARIHKELGVRVGNKGYVTNGRRTYFTIGPATCVHGRLHKRRPVTVHITDKVYLGSCNDPQCS